MVITTRMRSLLDGADEVNCSLLSKEASLELLLRAGGCEYLLENPPPAAATAIELCGRLPLALGIAGGIIAELADAWQENLLPLLKDEFGDASVEERVISASLRAVPKEMQAGVSDLFTLFAIFAEDSVVPAAAIDVVAPLMPHLSAIEAQQMRQVRRWLQQLVKANIMRGSIEGGVAVHDIVRDFMISRAEAAPEGGLRTTQREAVKRFLAAFDARNSASGYISASLHWHVRQAQQADVAIHADVELMRVLTHESGDIRKQGAIGIGLGKLRAAADACDAAGDNLEAAQVMFAAATLRGSAAGAETRRAWVSLRLLEEAGHGSSASRGLENRVLGALCVATEGGFAFGSAEHDMLLARMKALGAELSAGMAAGGMASKEVMDAEFAQGLSETMSAIKWEQITGYSGLLTHEDVECAHVQWSLGGRHFLAAMAAAPDATSSVVVSSWCAWMALACQRQHALPAFSFEALCGEGGALLRDTIEKYEHETVHPVAKGFGISVDFGMTGLEPFGLLLFVGDVTAARAGAIKIIDANRRVLARVKQGGGSADAYGYESFLTIAYLAPALWLMGDRKLLRDFMANSLAGACLIDEEIRQGVATFWKQWGWKSDDGHQHSTQASFMLILHAIATLLEAGGGDDTSRAALRKWLPPPSELLRITEFECDWRAQNPALHPALMCATLHGEQLGDWEVAAEVAEGVLRIEAFNPLLRVQSHRLLARANAALGRRAAACEASERAAAEASGAHYLWLEMLSLRDMLGWCEAEAADGVRSRVSKVVGRLAVSAEELTGVLGDGLAHC